MESTKFHLFPQLPYDIRYEIWKEFYNRPIHWGLDYKFNPGLWFPWHSMVFPSNPSYKPQYYCDDEICKEANGVRDIVRPIFEVPQWDTEPCRYKLSRVNWNTDFVWFPEADPMLGFRIIFQKHTLLKAKPDTSSTWLSNVQTLVLSSGPPRRRQYRHLPHDLFWELRTCFGSLRRVIWAFPPHLAPGDEEYTHQLHFYFELRSMMREYLQWKDVECEFSEMSLSFESHPQPGWSDYIEDAKELELQFFDVPETSEIEGANAGFPRRGEGLGSIRL